MLLTLCQLTWLVSLFLPLSQLFWDPLLASNFKLVNIFHKIVKCLSLNVLSFVCSVLNKIWVYEICKSLHCSYLLLPSTLTFLGLCLYCEIELSHSAMMAWSHHWDRLIIFHPSDWHFTERCDSASLHFHKTWFTFTFCLVTPHLLCCHSASAQNRKLCLFGFLTLC